MVNYPEGAKAKRVSALSLLLTESLRERMRWWSKTLKRVESWHLGVKAMMSQARACIKHGFP